MSQEIRMYRGWVILGGLMAAGLLGLPSPLAAQTASRASVARATLAGTSVLGITLPQTTTVLSDTGALPLRTTGALQASSIADSVPTLLSADSLHATVIGLPGEASSEASLGSLGMFVAGNTITAELILARAQAVTGSGGGAGSEIDGLVITAGTASLTFNGTGVSWISYTAPFNGIAEVYLDGALKATVDTYAPAEHAQVAVYTASGLPRGPHTITIKVIHTWNPSGCCAWIVVDAFDVSS